jgi:uncharacterized protein YkwD
LLSECWLKTDKPDADVFGMRRTTTTVGIAAAAVAAAWLLLAPGAKADCPVTGGVSVPGCPQGGPNPPSTLPQLPTTTTTKPPPPPPPAPPDTAAAARRLFDLVNAERTSRGMPAFARRADVDAIAVGHSRKMAARNDIWHNDDYFTAATKNAIGAVLLGENVALNRSIDDMHRRLMASPHHRDNILDRRFTQIGIGVAVADDGVLYGTENFLQPKAAARPPAAAKPAAPKAPAPAAAAAPDASVEPVAAATELAMPGPMDMVGFATPVPARTPVERGRAVGFHLLCALAAAALAGVTRLAVVRLRRQTSSMAGPTGDLRST